MFPFFTIFFIRHQHTLLCHVNQNERQPSLKHTSEPRGAVVCGLSLFLKRRRKRQRGNTLTPICLRSVLFICIVSSETLAKTSQHGEATTPKRQNVSIEIDQKTEQNWIL